MVVLCVTLERGACSDNTGAYCRARGKIPTVIVRRLALEVADVCEQQLPDGWLWKGRHVYLADGTTASMPDTMLNQAAYPQPPCQKAGLGFPMIRMVVLLSLATAMVKGMALGPYAGKETGETSLLRELLARFQPGDILLAQDNTGSGHRWKLIGEEPWRRAYMVYPGGAALPFKASAPKA